MVSYAAQKQRTYPALTRQNKLQLDNAKTKIKLTVFMFKYTLK